MDTEEILRECPETEDRRAFRLVKHTEQVAPSETFPAFSVVCPLSKAPATRRIWSAPWLESVVRHLASTEEGHVYLYGAPAYDFPGGRIGAETKTLFFRGRHHNPNTDTFRLDLGDGVFAEFDAPARKT